MFYDLTKYIIKSISVILWFSVTFYFLSVLLKYPIKSLTWTWPNSKNSFATECKSFRRVSKASWKAADREVEVNRSPMSSFFNCKKQKHFKVLTAPLVLDSWKSYHSILFLWLWWSKLIIKVFFCFFNFKWCLEGQDKREHEHRSCSNTGSCFGFDEITLRALKSAHSITFPRLQSNLGLLWFVLCLVLLALSAPRLPLKYAGPQCCRVLICRYDLD